MSPSRHRFPSDADLEGALGPLLRRTRPAPTGLRILERQPSEHNSFPREMVVCGFDDGSVLRLHCKYSRELRGHVDGLRLGVEYEAEVYERLLHQCGSTLPTFFGTFEDPHSGRICLVLEYLTDAQRVTWSVDGLEKATAWLAKFHATHARGSSERSTAVLNALDPSHFDGWCAEAVRSATTWLADDAEVATLAERARQWLPTVLTSDCTFIHGEFYPANILIRHGEIYPVDWESAAWATGALDVAALIDGWPSEAGEACVRSYEKARWGDAVPAGFAEALDAARIYWPLRRLATLTKPKRVRHLRRELAELHPIARLRGLV